MKTAIALLVLSLSLESTLLAIETQHRAAIAAKDFATLSTIYADDFRAIFGNGEIFDRAALFDVFRADDGAWRVQRSQHSGWLCAIQCAGDWLHGLCNVCTFARGHSAARRICRCL